MAVLVTGYGFGITFIRQPKVSKYSSTEMALENDPKPVTRHHQKKLPEIPAPNPRLPIFLISIRDSVSVLVNRHRDQRIVYPMV